jgi:hypothetical protein
MLIRRSRRAVLAPLALVTLVACSGAEAATPPAAPPVVEAPADDGPDDVTPPAPPALPSAPAESVFRPA